MSLQRKINKPKTQRGKRFVQNREPKVFENTRQLLGVRTSTANEVVVKILKDLCALKKPDAAFLGRKHEFRPFESEQELEKLSYKYDASLLLTGSDNKKRPRCITFCRMYDYHILDMFEFCIENFRGIKDFDGPKPPLGNKPLLIFKGDAFEHDQVYQKIKLCFIDFFRGPTVEKVRPGGIVHGITFTSLDGKIHMRTFAVSGVGDKKDASSEDTSLTLIGPSMDFTLKRSKLASEDLWKVACKVPVEAKVKQTKNISKDVFGTQFGRVHMGTQDYSKLVTKKMKGLRKTADESRNGEPNVPMDEDNNEDDWADIGGDLD